MGARIIQLADVRARRREAVHAFKGVEGSEHFADRFHFWGGASGRRYVHTIYSLIECPEFTSGNYLLVRREADGRRTVLGVGRAAEEAATLNLARIRQEGATAGANEVHVHLLADTPWQSSVIEADLRSAQLPAEARVTRICH